MADDTRLVELRKTEYDQRQALAALMRAVYDRGEAAALPKLTAAQAELHRTEQAISAILADQKQAPVVIATTTPADASGSAAPASAAPVRRDVGVLRQPIEAGGAVRQPVSNETTRGLESTGLEVGVVPRMQYVPTATYHLLDPDADPLVQCNVKTKSKKIRRVRIIAFIEGYSAQAVRTVEITEDKVAPPILLLPTLFRERTQQLNEITRATLNVLAEDVDSQRIEIHITIPIWLLAYNTAPLGLRDPATGVVKSIAYMLGAFVTPHQPRVLKFLREVVEFQDDKELAGRDGLATDQAKAIFEALKAKAGITYVNSLVDFNPDTAIVSQRVRLPRESLDEGQANCLDGTLLFASLLESIGLNARVVLVPKHALVGWETGQDKWQYCETTMLRSSTFDDACAVGNDSVTTYASLHEAQPNQGYLQLLNLRDLRTVNRILPLE